MQIEDADRASEEAPECCRTIAVRFGWVWIAVSYGGLSRPHGYMEIVLFGADGKQADRMPLFQNEVEQIHKVLGEFLQVARGGDARCMSNGYTNIS